jgi:hypothetical protein
MIIHAHAYNIIWGPIIKNSKHSEKTVTVRFFISVSLGVPRWPGLGHQLSGAESRITTRAAMPRGETSGSIPGSMVFCQRPRVKNQQSKYVKIMNPYLAEIMI